MRIYLAPMEGVLDHHLRGILTRVGGIDICVTEFVRVTDHVLPEKVFKRASPELLGMGLGACCPTRIQLLGSNPDALAGNAEKAAKLGAPAIDLNFGCPAKTVNKNRGGACLLKETDTLYHIVKAVRDAVPQPIPVTAKIRLGYDERDSYLDNAQAIAEAGANELAVHARSKKDGYQPPAYWECIGEIVEKVGIPVIANGEIWSEEDYIRCQQQSRCKDIMIGRGLLARPDLGRAIKAQKRGEAYTPMPWAEVAAMLLEFFEITSREYASKFMGNRAKQWLFYLQRQYPEAGVLFNHIKRSRDYETIRAAIYKHSVPAENLARMG